MSCFIWSLNTGLTVQCYFVFSIHICCTLLHTKAGVADKFIADVKANVREIVADPNAHTGGMVSRVGRGEGPDLMNI